MPTDTLIQKARDIAKRAEFGVAGDLAEAFLRAVELLRGEHRHSDIGHREPTELCPTCDFLRDVGADHV